MGRFLGNKAIRNASRHLHMHTHTHTHIHMYIQRHMYTHRHTFTSCLDTLVRTGRNDFYFSSYSKLSSLGNILSLRLMCKKFTQQLSWGKENIRGNQLTN